MIVQTKGGEGHHIRIEIVGEGSKNIPPHELEFVRGIAGFVQFFLATRLEIKTLMAQGISETIRLAKMVDGGGNGRRGLF